MRLSDRIATVRPSATLAVTAKVLELKAEGREVIGFGAGEPDFRTWPHVCEAAHQAIDRGEFYYTAVGGTPDLKKAIRTKLARDNQLEYADKEVVASCGGKHTLYNLMQVTLNPGDEVVIPGPYWVSYRDMALLAGAEPKVVMAREESGFLLSPEELAAAVTDRTRMIIINSPSNPTGAAYSEASLQSLASVLADKDCWVVCDDVYEFIRYDGESPRHMLNLEPRLREHAVVVNSVSKTYAMTGWRLGYAAGPAPLVKAMTTLQGQSTTNPTSIVQVAAGAALSGPQDELQPMVEEFKRRRDYVCDRIGTIDGLSVVVPQGAFYVFVNVAGVLERAGAADGDELALKLLEGAGVGLVGGNDFGSPAHVRISYATSMEQLERGFDNIEAWLKSV